MPGVLTYNPQQVAVILGGKIIEGFADGTFVKLERDEDMWTMVTGVDGQGSRAKTNNYAGKLTLTLFSTSPSNDVLSTFASVDELTGAGAIPMLLRDGSGRTVASALTAWVTKYPDTEFAKEVSQRTWIVQTDNLQIFIGGN